MTPLPKKELIRQVKRFLKDPNRGISVALFAQLCGIDKSMLHDVFLYETVPLSEYIQGRVNKGLYEMQQGNVRIMKRPDNTRYVDYRREPKPVWEPKFGLMATSEGIKLKIGMKNRNDYSDATLDETMRG